MDYSQDEHQQLVEMRQQLDILRKKLDKEALVSEELFKETMKSRVSNINRQGWASILCAIFVILTIPTYVDLLSLAFIFGTITLMLVSIVVTLWIHNPVRSRRIMIEDLLTVAIKMKKVKKYYVLSMWIGLPVILAWLIWFCIELHQVFGEISYLFIIGACIGGIIGGIISWFMYRKVVDNCNAIIKQIEEE